jgi:hypothetical protein
VRWKVLPVPVIAVSRYGTTAYAGTLAAGVTLAKAGAPLAAAGLLASSGGYLIALAAIGSACLVAAGGILTRATSPRPAPVDAMASAAGRG